MISFDLDVLDIAKSGSFRGYAWMLGLAIENSEDVFLKCDIIAEFLVIVIMWQGGRWIFFLVFTLFINIFFVLFVVGSVTSKLLFILFQLHQKIFIWTDLTY